MEQFPFYKQRSFRHYISDTFGFLKFYFKNFTKIYFIIHAPILLLMAFIATMSIANASPLELTNIIFINATLLAFTFFISYLFPYIYGLYAEKHPQERIFQAEEIFKAMKNKIGKTIIYYSVFFIFVLGVSMVLSVISLSVSTTAQTFLIIIYNLLAFLILPILIPQGFIAYIGENKNLKDSLLRAWQILQENYIHKLIAFVIVNTISFLMFYAMIGLGILLFISIGITGFNIESLIINSSPLSLVIFCLLIFIALLVGIFILYLQIILQLIFYYSSKEEVHQINIIDQIGEKNN